MSDSIRIGLRAVGLVIGIVIGWQFGSLLGQLGDEGESGDATFMIALVIGTIGYILGPRLTWAFLGNIQATVKNASVADLVAVALGLVFGGLVSALVAVPLALLPSPFGSVLPIVTAAILIALAIAVALLRKRDLVVPLIRGRLVPRTAPSTQSIAGAAGAISGLPQTLLDTSVLIDGRVVDLLRTGFLDGRLVLPRFVLDELQHVADSDDALRRSRGRRGLETLNRLRQLVAERQAELEILDVEFDRSVPREVDAKLINLAKERGYRILTNDFNLERVAQIQGVKILNLHELAGALRPPVLPGEELNLKLVQEGREAGQGIGFLDDGTMVVVDGGKPWVGQQTSVTVTRLLQTGAGRMVFAVPKHAGTSV